MQLIKKKGEVVWYAYNKPPSFISSSECFTADDVLPVGGSTYQYLSQFVVYPEHSIIINPKYVKSETIVSKLTESNVNKDKSKELHIDSIKILTSSKKEDLNTSIEKIKDLSGLDLISSNKNYLY